MAFMGEAAELRRVAVELMLHGAAEAEGDRGKAHIVIPVDSVCKNHGMNFLISQCWRFSVL